MRRAHYRAKWLAVWLVAILGANAGLASDALRVVSLKSPAPEQSMTPFLTATEDGLWLSWLERVEDGHALRFSTWDGEGFGPPSTIHTSDHFFANWADFSSILSFGDGRLAAHWLEKAAGGTYEYDVFIALSEDGGKSWGKPERPHRDGTLNEHGFVPLVADDASGFSAVWLDGRGFKKGASDNEMTLRTTRFDGKAFTEDVLLDGRICECCQTGMARAESGLFVAYRNRSDDDTEIRDINYVRQDAVSGEWTEPKSLHDDGWEIPGCPVNGPQVTASGNRLAVAWFSASSSEPKVQLLFSEDGGASFGEPIRIDDGRPVGRVDVEWIGEDVAVTWLERGEDRQGEIRVKRVAPSGDPAPAVVVARTASGRASGFPRMTRFDDEIYVTWTESYERRGPSQVHVAKLVSEAPLLDEPAFDFEAEDVDGKAYTLGELEGKVVLLNFWGIWCKSCREEIPHLVTLDERLRERGLVVLGADYGDEPEDLPAYIEEIGMSYPVLLDDGLADDYEVLVFPTSVVIDRNGRVRYRVEGFREKSFRDLERVVERLLAES